MGADPEEFVPSESLSRSERSFSSNESCGSCVEASEFPAPDCVATPVVAKPDPVVLPLLPLQPYRRPIRKQIRKIGRRCEKRIGMKTLDGFPGGFNKGAEGCIS
jgi:hypothetical protein